MITQQLTPVELLALAKFDIEKQNYEPALIKLKEASGDENLPESRLILARLYAALKLFPLAQLQYQNYLKLQLDDIQARFELGMALFDAGDITTALNCWGEVLDRKPAFPPALFYVVVAYIELGKPENARSSLLQFKRLVSETNGYYQRVGELEKVIADRFGFDSGEGMQVPAAGSTIMDSAIEESTH